MLRALLFTTTATLLSLRPASATGEEGLSLERALQLVREQGPAVLAARLLVEEARGRRLAALPLLAENPVLGGGLGRRFAGADSRKLEADLELMQPLELGGRRGARLAAADADLAASAADGEAVLHQMEAEVARAFFRGLHAVERLRLASATEETLVRSVQALLRRHQAGDVPVLEVNLARTALARAQAAVSGARALRLAAEAELRGLLGLGEAGPLALLGDLRRQRRYELAPLLERAAVRADARARQAEARAARAEQRLARAEAWPRLGLGAAYEREDGADVLLGRLTLELPLFQRGQGRDASADARARRFALQAEALRRSAASAVRAAYGAHQERLTAVRTLEAVLPLVDDNEALAGKSHEAGHLSLADWLVVRRETLETRADYVDRLLEAAEAGVTLALAAGVAP